LAQWTRHRLASPSVESQRYCNYGKNDQGITYINPWFDSDKVDQDSWDNFVCACEDAESAYMTLLEAGNKPEMARDVLPQCTATHMVWTANIREIRHFLRMRTSLAAEKEIRTLANAMYDLLVENGLQILVEDIPVKHA
jgi:thymidylate synthase (FAD)